jgi:signal transduction histidine kinase
VDGEADNRTLLSRRLRALPGWRLSVDAVADGEAALKKLQETSFDLVFVDYRPPGEEGLAILEKIRQLHAQSAVVMMALAGSEQLAVSAMKKGALDYLTREELSRLDFDTLFRRIVDRRSLLNQNMELRQVNQMKNEFIANVSHELRTPLTVVIGYARSMQEGSLGPLNERQNKALEAIVGRSEGLLGTLNNILRLREIHEGRQQLLLQPTSLKKLLAAKAETARKEMSGKKQALEFSLPAGDVWTLADARRLGDVLENLLSNASKFAPAGSTVTVMLQAKQDQALISVKDQGDGVPPEMLPHLFEKFASSTQHGPTRQHPGLGLGLAICKQIMEAHGGRIWLESQRSGGCTAWLSLPLASHDEQDVVVDRPPSIDKKRILIVEDNPDLIDILILFMSSISTNLELATAQSGFEALDSIKEKLPDLIILDVMMPGMDGFEVISRLKRLPETQRIPVMVLTGYTDAAEKAKTIGASEVLLKPFEKKAFIANVLKLLETP